MKVKLDIPYPEIKVEKENAYYADLLGEDYAGQISEATAVMLYSYQHFVQFNKNKEFSKLIEEIAEVEMRHMEILGKLINLLGKEPIYRTCEASRGDCVMWSASNVNYASDLKEMLKVNIDSESAAIRTYEHHKKIIEDKYIKAILDRIILDEKNHLQIFKELYDEITC